MTKIDHGQSQQVKEDTNGCFGEPCITKVHINDKYNQGTHLITTSIIVA